MPSKRKTTATKEDAKPALVPKLRFPEFRGTALRIVQLGDVTEEGRSRNGKKHSVASVMGVTKADGIVPMESRLIAQDIARYKLVQKDWFAYNPMRLNIGSVARWKGESEILVSPDYVVFKCISEDESGITPGYLDQFRQTKAWEEFVTEGGDGSVRVRIYYKDIARVRLALPSPAEQQKIAECLSSVDEVIAAQARKVDALKTHKKGLMQQLFPREGETQPRLRFPKFQNAGDWEEQPLKKVFSIFQGFAFSSGDSVEQGCRWLKIADVGIQVMNHDAPSFLPEAFKEHFSKFAVREGDYVVALTRPILSGQLKIAKVDDVFDGALLNQRVGKLLTSQDPAFVFFLLQTQKLIGDIERSISGNDPPNLSAQQIEGLKTFVPSPPEQHRIATCLSSLDALIAAETQKHAALQCHKRGLMQQIFPSPEANDV